MKINRLLEITILLINKGAITAKELADRFEVSTRTIYRDIDVLSGAGVPVYTNKGSKGGICLLEDYALNKAIFNEHESNSLVLAIKTLQAIRYPQLDGVLDKMGAMFKNAAHSDWVNIEFPQWGSGPNEDDKFVKIKHAILNRKIITFEYVNAQDKKSDRSVEPVQLIFRGQAWYLWGFCAVRDEFRTFRISRIKNLAVTDKSFQKRLIANTGVDEASNENNPADAVPDTTFKLRFQPEILHRVYDDFNEELIARNADGTYDITFSMPEDEWVYGYILSFGSYAEVLEPAHLRNIIYSRLKKTLSHYEVE